MFEENDLFTNSALRNMPANSKNHILEERTKNLGSFQSNFRMLAGAFYGAYREQTLEKSLYLISETLRLAKDIKAENSEIDIKDLLTTTDFALAEDKHLTLIEMISDVYQTKSQGETMPTGIEKLKESIITVLKDFGVTKNPFETEISSEIEIPTSSNAIPAWESSLEFQQKLWVNQTANSSAEARLNGENHSTLLLTPIYGEDINQNEKEIPKYTPYEANLKKYFAEEVDKLENPDRSTLGGSLATNDGGGPSREGSPVLGTQQNNKQNNNNGGNERVSALQSVSNNDDDTTPASHLAPAMPKPLNSNEKINNADGAESDFSVQF